MTKCANSTSGSFREGWVMYNDAKGASCTPCGEGIYSEARELDENPMANNGSMVMATSASCCEYSLYCCCYLVWLLSLVPVTLHSPQQTQA
jgi:hypothetical protein